MEQITLEQWLALPATDIAAQVWEHRIGVLLTSDGTRRHYLLQHPEENGRITNFPAYMMHCAKIYIHAFEVLYSLGVHAILTPSLFPPNFRRSPMMVQFFLESTRQSLLREPYLSFYKKWNIKSRLYGDYDIAPAAEPIRDGLIAVHEELRSITPEGERLLLFGYTAGSFLEEIITRTAILRDRLNHLPSPEDLRKVTFPEGPEQIKIHIGGGGMAVGAVLPSTLDNGTDLYFTTGLPLDITDEMMRRILYDHLFLRHVAPEDNADYTIEDLEVLREYYAECGEGVIGLGRLVGPGIWYAQ